MSFYVSTGSTCGAVQATTATWTSQTLNTNIALSTSAFLGVRVLLSGYPVYVSSSIPALQDITLNWTAAAGRPHTASQVFDNRYWLSYTTGTSNTAFNNNVLIYDSMGHWSQFTGVNAATLFTYNRILYAGSSLSDGNVIVENTGVTDLGLPYLFDFRSPDYELDAFNDVHLYDLNLEFAAVPEPYAPSTTVQYYVDRGTTAYTLGSVPLAVGRPGLRFSTARFGQTASPTRANTLSFEILDNTATPITFYRSMIRYNREDGP